MVYVLNKYGEPLMPTERHGKVKWLLKENRAKVVKLNPFTIQLLYDSNNYKQEITLGIDPGSKFIGFSASTDKKELICGEVVLRDDVHENLICRKEHRNFRRYRKTRYRKPRFANRGNKKEGWLAPSIEEKIYRHSVLVKRIKQILPICNIIIEGAKFNTEFLRKDDIADNSSNEFFNLREAILYRDDHLCQACKGKSGDTIYQVHHIVPKSNGGTNAWNNLITLCKTCHRSYHNGTLKYSIDYKSIKNNVKYATHLDLMRNRIIDIAKSMCDNVSVVFGYETKKRRVECGLTKTHYNDAYCIANNLNAKRLDKYYTYKCLRNHNRKLHKDKITKGGKRADNQSPKYLNGFKNYDRVRLDTGEIGYIFVRRRNGQFKIISDFRDNSSFISTSKTYNKLTLIESSSSMICCLVEKVK